MKKIKEITGIRNIDECLDSWLRIVKREVTVLNSYLDNNNRYVIIFDTNIFDKTLFSSLKVKLLSALCRGAFDGSKFIIQYGKIILPLSESAIKEINKLKNKEMKKLDKEYKEVIQEGKGRKQKKLAFKNVDSVVKELEIKSNDGKYNFKIKPVGKVGAEKPFKIKVFKVSIYCYQIQLAENMFMEVEINKDATVNLSVINNKFKQFERKGKPSSLKRAVLDDDGTNIDPNIDWINSFFKGWENLAQQANLIKSKESERKSKLKSRKK